MSLLKQGKRIICVVVIVAVAFLFSKTWIWYWNSKFLISFLANSLSLWGNYRSSPAIDATNLSSASISFFFALVSIFYLILLRSNTFSCSSLSGDLIDNFLFWKDFCVLQTEAATFSGKFSYVLTTLGDLPSSKYLSVVWSSFKSRASDHSCDSHSCEVGSSSSRTGWLCSSLWLWSNWDLEFRGRTKWSSHVKNLNGFNSFSPLSTASLEVPDIFEFFKLLRFFCIILLQVFECSFALAPKCKIKLNVNRSSYWKVFLKKSFSFLPDLHVVDIGWPVLE